MAICPQIHILSHHKYQCQHIIILHTPLHFTRSLLCCSHFSVWHAIAIVWCREHHLRWNSQWSPSCNQPVWSNITETATLQSECLATDQWNPPKNFSLLPSLDVSAFSPWSWGKDDDLWMVQWQTDLCPSIYTYDEKLLLHVRHRHQVDEPSIWFPNVGNRCNNPQRYP